MFKFFEKIKKNSFLRIGLVIFLVILLGFVLYFINGSSLNNSKEIESLSYVEGLEYKLSTALSKVEGAGNVSVVITVESGGETVLAMKTTTNKTSEGVEIVETPILVNGKTVVLKELNPKIIGVLIVAEGANSISVLSKIQQATVSLLNINVNQIEILTMC